MGKGFLQKWRSAHRGSHSKRDTHHLFVVSRKCNKRKNSEDRINN